MNNFKFDFITRFHYIGGLFSLLKFLKSNYEIENMYPRLNFQILKLLLKIDLLVMKRAFTFYKTFSKIKLIPTITDVDVFPS